jgi:hypothetical protein
MYKKMLCLWAVIALLSWSAAAQKAAPVDSFQKSFTKFAGIVPGVDFYASDRALVTPFTKPIADGLERLKSVLGPNLTPGALVICQTVAQRDAVAEERVLKYGYKWILVQLTAQAEQEQQLEMVKARMGGQIPPELLARFQQQRTPEQNAAALSRTATNLVVRLSSAVLQTLLSPERRYSSSRLDDHSRSPLYDWLDVGIGRYAADNAMASVRWTQDHIEDVFAVEDLIQMNRPYVLPDSIGGNSSRGGGGGAGGGGSNGTRVVTMGGAGGSGGGGTPAGGASQGASGSGAATGGGRGGGRGDSNLPKEVLDRQNFDNQSALFFTYLIEKLGIDKIRQLVQINREEKNLAQTIVSPEFLGKSFDDIEKDFMGWIKAQKAAPPQMMRMPTGGN